MPGRMFMTDTSSYADYGCDVSFTVRYGEAGGNGLASLSSVGNWLQEAASESAEQLGFGASALFPRGLTWILNRLALHIRRLPAAGESLTVHTWPSILDRFGHRGYEIFDAAGSLIISGSSSWSVLELASRTLVPIPSDLTAFYPENPRPLAPFSFKVMPRLKSRESGTPIIVRKDDLDINGHVNNTRYLAWILEAFPEEHISSDFPRLIDITFRSECFPQEHVASTAEEIPLTESMGSIIPGCPINAAYAHAIRKEDGSDACRAVTLWSRSGSSAAPR